MIADRIDIAEEVSGFPIEFDEPAGSSVRSTGNARQPDRVFVEFQAEALSVLVPFAKVFSLQVEALNASILAICNVDHAVLIDLNGVRQIELTRAGSCTAPLANFLTLR